ncbi:Plexin-D1 [Manis pentadactyla]|nr:Plexin-D1 [Manis pentadactyla]
MSLDLMTPLLCGTPRLLPTVNSGPPSDHCSLPTRPGLGRMDPNKGKMSVCGKGNIGFVLSLETRGTLSRIANCWLGIVSRLKAPSGPAAQVGARFLGEPKAPGGSLPGQRGA